MAKSSFSQKNTISGEAPDPPSVPDDSPQLNSAPQSPVQDVLLDQPPLQDGLPTLGAIPRPKNVTRGKHNSINLYSSN